MRDDLILKILKTPKAELHVHLEGSISVETLNLLASRKRLPSFGGNPYRFSSFKEFDALFPSLGPYFDTAEDFYEIAAAFASRLVEEGIVYCEVFIMPFVHARRGIEFSPLMAAVDEAFKQEEDKSGVQIRIICSIPRTAGREAGFATLKWIDAHPYERIVGIDLAGEERPGTIEAFVPVFERARAMGLGTVAHAGELLGPEAIWETIKKLRPRRIGHGISSYQDKKLMEFLAEKQIPLDISMTSNVKLGVVQSIMSHPIRVFYEQGIPFTISTDDPAFFQTTLVNEYRILKEYLQLGENELGKIITSAFSYKLK